MHKNSFAESRCVVVLQLMGVDVSALKEALTHKKLTAKGEEVIVLLLVSTGFHLFGKC